MKKDTAITLNAEFSLIQHKSSDTTLVLWTCAVGYVGMAAGTGVSMLQLVRVLHQ